MLLPSINLIPNKQVDQIYSGPWAALVGSIVLFYMSPGNEPKIIHCEQNVICCSLAHSGTQWALQKFNIGYGNYMMVPFDQFGERIHGAMCDDSLLYRSSDVS